MMIYAIFLCTSIGCQPFSGGIHYVPGPTGESAYFASLEECRKFLISDVHGMVDGILRDGVTFRCLGKRVETWQ